MDSKIGFLPDFIYLFNKYEYLIFYIATPLLLLSKFIIYFLKLI